MGCAPKRCPWQRLPIRCAPCLTYVDGEPKITGLTLEESAALIEAAYAYVEDLMFHKTGGRWIGTCNEKCLRPCPPCYCIGSCRCGFYQRIDLFESLDCHDALEVVRFTVDGVDHTLDFVWGDGLYAPKWRIENCRYLVWQVPDGCSTCGSLPPQDLSRPIGAACTWEICIRYGSDPPYMVLKAVADMVAEQIKACVPDAECALDDNVESVTERGRKYTFRKPSDTNSGVWSWDEAMRCFGPIDDPKGPEGIFLPPGYGGRIVESSGGIITPSPPPPGP